MPKQECLYACKSKHPNLLNVRFQNCKQWLHEMIGRLWTDTLILGSMEQKEDRIDPNWTA